MAGKLYADEIRNTATTGSPTFPNGLDISELVDPVGEEGDVLTVQADGSIAAAAGGGGGSGLPIQVDGIADLSSASQVVQAIKAALNIVTPENPRSVTFPTTLLDGSSHQNFVLYYNGGEGAGWGGWAGTGAGSVLVWGVSFS